MIKKSKLFLLTKYLIVIFFVSGILLSCSNSSGSDEDGGKTYSIGDTGPSGVGIVFYITDYDSTGAGIHGLEAAPSGWYGTSDDPVAELKTSDTTTDGTLEAIGTGYANTYTYLTGDIHPAAALCRAYRSSNEGDWFLPSKEELHELYSKKDTVGGLTCNFYWSSSEDNSSENSFFYAWYCNSNNILSTSSKTCSYGVRPIRSF